MESTQNDPNVPTSTNSVLPTETPSTPVSQPAQAVKLLPASSNKWPRYLLIIILGLSMVGLGTWIISLVNNKNVVKTKQSAPVVDGIRTAGKIIIGTEATFPPMEFMNDAGEYTGYDIELGQRIAEKLGVTAEFKQIVFDDFIDELNKKNVDIVLSSVSITDERKTKVQFSDPYLNAGQVILTTKDNTTITSTADLRGKKIAVQKGTTNEEQAKSFTSDELILRFDDYAKATEALLDGSADAIFSDLTGAKGIIDTNPGLKVASEPFTQEAYGVVMRLGEEDLLLEMNSIINSLRQQGVLTFLKQKWLD